MTDLNWGIEPPTPGTVSANVSQFRKRAPRAEQRAAAIYDSRYPTPYRVEVTASGETPAAALAALRAAYKVAEAQLLTFAENDPETAA